MDEKTNMVVQITESVQGIVKATKIQTTEEPFIPGQKTIKAVMTPAVSEDVYMPTYTPLSTLITPFEVEQRSCIRDIETTVLYPWYSKII